MHSRTYRRAILEPDEAHRSYNANYVSHSALRKNRRRVWSNQWLTNSFRNDPFKINQGLVALTSCSRRSVRTSWPHRLWPVKKRTSWYCHQRLRPCCKCLASGNYENYMLGIVNKASRGVHVFQPTGIHITDILSVNVYHGRSRPM